MHWKGCTDVPLSFLIPESVPMSVESAVGNATIQRKICGQFPANVWEPVLPHVRYFHYNQLFPRPVPASFQR